MGTVEGEEEAGGMLMLARRIWKRGWWSMKERRGAAGEQVKSCDSVVYGANMLAAAGRYVMSSTCIVGCAAVKSA